MATNIVTHRPVNTTFKNNPRTGFLGTLSRTFKVEKLGQPIGELFEVIASELKEDRVAFSYPVTFSLVNVTNAIQNRSVGYSVSPPSGVLGKSYALAFTFALTGRPYKKTPPPVNNSAVGQEGYETVTYWSSNRVGSEYVTISFSRALVAKLGLSYNTDQDMTYIYNCIGMLTKNFVQDPSWYQDSGQHSDINTSDVNEYSLYTKYFKAGLRSLMNTAPMNAWIYNSDVWTMCSNVLSKNFLHIDTFGLYYLMYLTEFAESSPASTLYKELHSEVGGIYDYIQQGIQDLNVSLANPVTPISDNCYAIIHLLENLVYPGGIGPVVDKQEAAVRVGLLRNAFKNDNQLQGEFYTYMSTGKKAYVSLVQQDIRLRHLMENIL